MEMVSKHKKILEQIIPGSMYLHLNLINMPGRQWLGFIPLPAFYRKGAHQKTS